MGVGGGVTETKSSILRFFHSCWFPLGLTKRYNNIASSTSKACIKRKFEPNFTLILWSFGVSSSDQQFLVFIVPVVPC